MLALVFGVGCDGESGGDPGGAGRATIAPGEALGSLDVEGFARAASPREFSFPADHGPHPKFRTEWWYATGNLRGATSGRRFGYQITIFRNALTAEKAAGRSSGWSMRDLWFAHFAVTDVEGGQLRGSERFSRDGHGLAGAQAVPFRVWLEDWEFVGESEIGGVDPLRIRATTDDGGAGVDLVLTPSKPHVLQGEAGLSQKSSAVGNASYYYSFTRMLTRGQVRIDGESFDVEGSSWLDREWSTSALGEAQVGWDWFALQLDDGRDLMLYRLRNNDGSIDPASAGTLVDPDGNKTKLTAQDADVEVLRTWASPSTGSTYPIAWRVRVPAANLDLQVTAVLADQEHDFLVRYWEGAVDIRATNTQVPQGVGYVELTGYPQPDTVTNR